MKTLTLSHDRMHWLDKICRGALLKTLSRLHTGGLLLREGDNRY